MPFVSLMAWTRPLKVMDAAEAAAISSAIEAFSERTRGRAGALCDHAATGTRLVATTSTAESGLRRRRGREPRVIGVHLRGPSGCGPQSQRQERLAKPIN